MMSYLILIVYFDINKKEENIPIDGVMDIA